MIFNLFLVCLVWFSHSNAQVVKLGSYNVDTSAITVSGISAGGAMATQLHIAYSTIFSGVGIIAGPPYYCAAGSVNTATTTCMSSLISSPVASTLKRQIDTYAAGNSIDPVSNLANDKLYIFSGTADSTVKQNVVKVNEDLYKLIAPNMQKKTIYSTAAAHGFITNNYGTACGTTNSQYYINNCNYNQAYDMLNFFYNLQNPEPSKTTVAKEALIEYDQTEFFPSGSSTMISMDNSAYAYIPAGCKSGKRCKLHIALHGCLQQKSKIGNVFAKETGFNPVADENDIIILYPQAKASSFNPSNPNSCFDWWGYSNANYANKGGYQMQAIRKMIERLTGPNSGSGGSSGGNGGGGGGGGITCFGKI